jgi:hypothetical protein
VCIVKIASVNAGPADTESAEADTIAAAKGEGRTPAKTPESVAKQTAHQIHRVVPIGNRKIPAAAEITKINGCHGTIKGKT